MATIKYKDENGEWVELSIGGGGGSITLDSEMSDTSENAVSNKVIKEYVDNAVANSGGGSGQGALRVYTMQGSSLGSNDAEEIAQYAPNAANSLMSLVEANAVTYAQIVAELKAGNPAPLVVLDMGMGVNVMNSAMAEAYPDMEEGHIVKSMWNKPVALVADYELKDGEETFLVKLIDSEEVLSAPAPHKLAGWVLSADGSCIYEEATA